MSAGKRILPYKARNFFAPTKVQKLLNPLKYESLATPSYLIRYAAAIRRELQKATPTRAALLRQHLREIERPATI